MNRSTTQGLNQPGTPPRRWRRLRSLPLLLATVLLVLPLAGCESEGENPSGTGIADSGNDDGRPDGVDPALVDAEPGDCLDAFSERETYDHAEPKDCNSDEAFLVVSYRTHDLDCESAGGDYAAVNVGAARLCVRLHAELGECWADVRVDCNADPASRQVIGVVSADDENCGIPPVDDSFTMRDQRRWGLATEELSYVYPKDDLRICILDRGIAALP